MTTYRWMIRAVDDAPGTYSMEEPGARIEAQDIVDAERTFAEQAADGLIARDGRAEVIE